MTQAFVEPKAAWRVTLDGNDLTAKIAPRLISLTITEDLQERADRLEITLHDHDGAMQLPTEGARLIVAIGWEKGTGVTAGLVAKGSFRVDDVSHSGPPDIITISAHSADFADSFRTRRNRTWHGKALREIVDQLAYDNGLTPACHPDLAAIVVTSLEQANKSDMQLLRDLGRRYDATATVKAGKLIFAPVNAATTATGAPIGTIMVTRQSGDHHEYRRASRENAQDGAEAQYFDQDTATRHTVAAGGSNRRRLKRVYSSRQDATAAANAERNRLDRAAATLSLTLAYGDARIGAGMKATARGFKSEIDAKAWRVSSAKHNLGPEGFSTELEMQTA